MDQALILATLIAPVVIALVQMLKLTFTMPKKVIPLVGFVVGLLVGAACFPFSDLDVVMRLWAGGLAGLSATGLFELAFNKREGYTK